MTNPVISTSVATNGADALAGSSPQRRSKKGSMDPAVVPNITTPTRLHPMASHPARLRTICLNDDQIVRPVGPA